MYYPARWSPARGGSAAASEAPNFLFCFFRSPFLFHYPLSTFNIKNFKRRTKALNLEIKIRKFTFLFFWFLFRNWFNLMIEGLDLLESARVLLMGSALVCAGLARRWCCCSGSVLLASVVDFNGLNGWLVGVWLLMVLIQWCLWYRLKVFGGFDLNTDVGFVMCDVCCTVVMVLWFCWVYDWIMNWFVRIYCCMVYGRFGVMLCVYGHCLCSCFGWDSQFRLELWYSRIRFLIVFAGLKCLTVFCYEIGCVFVGLLVTLQVAGFYSVQIQVRVCWNWAQSLLGLEWKAADQAVKCEQLFGFELGPILDLFGLISNNK